MGLRIFKMENNEKKRLRFFLKEKKITQTELANEIGMTQSGVSSILNSDIEITKNHALLLKATYNLNPEWLLNGTEPMYLPHQNKFSDSRQADLNIAYESIDEDGKGKLHTEAVKLHSEFKNRQKKHSTFSNITNIDVDFRMLPILGTIPAGPPKIVPITTGEEVPVPIFKMVKNREYYALKVEGNSMNDCGIHEGDIVILERRHDPENNKICAVRVDGEYTLKRFHYNKHSHKVTLIPCNPDYEIKEYPENSVDVEGVMISKMNYGY